MKENDTLWRHSATCGAGAESEGEMSSRVEQTVMDL